MTTSKAIPGTTAFPLFLELDVDWQARKRFADLILVGRYFASHGALSLMAHVASDDRNIERVRFARCKGRDLGFTGSLTIRELKAKVIGLGHALCEPPDMYAIRLAHTGARNEAILVASEEIVTLDRRRGIFYLTNHNGRRGINASVVEEAVVDYGTSDEHEIVFRLGK